MGIKYDWLRDNKETTVIIINYINLINEKVFIVFLRRFFSENEKRNHLSLEILEVVQFSVFYEFKLRFSLAVKKSFQMFKQCFKEKVKITLHFLSTLRIYFLSC